MAERTHDPLVLSPQEKLERAAQRLQEENERLRGERDALRREAEMREDDAQEMLDDTRRALLACFPEMDRLGIAMLHRNAHEGEWNVPALAEHVASRLESAHTPKREESSALVAQRMEELRERAEAAEREVAALRDTSEALPVQKEERPAAGFSEQERRVLDNLDAIENDHVGPRSDADAHIILTLIKALRAGASVAQKG